MVQKEQYCAIDLLKFFASVFVIAIHTNPFGNVSNYLSVLSMAVFRLAVPIFFCVSSFFFSKNDINLEGTKKYTKRLLILYLCWFVISLPITIYNRFIVSKYSLPITIFRFVRSIFFSSTFSGSWFLVASIFGSWMLFVTEKYVKHKKIFLISISVISYLICVLTSGYGVGLSMMCYKIRKLRR